MHAQNQQDFIYKHGQAGIIKASVTYHLCQLRQGKRPTRDGELRPENGNETGAFISLSDIVRSRLATAEFAFISAHPTAEITEGRGTS